MSITVAMKGHLMTGAVGAIHLDVHLRTITYQIVWHVEEVGTLGQIAHSTSEFHIEIAHMVGPHLNISQWAVASLNHSQVPLDEAFICDEMRQIRQKRL